MVVATIFPNNVCCKLFDEEEDPVNFNLQFAVVPVVAAVVVVVAVLLLLHASSFCRADSSSWLVLLPWICGGSKWVPSDSD